MKRVLCSLVQRCTCVPPSTAPHVCPDSKGRRGSKTVAWGFLPRIFPGGAKVAVFGNPDLPSVVEVADIDEIEGL